MTRVKMVVGVFLKNLAVQGKLIGVLIIYVNGYGRKKNEMRVDKYKIVEVKIDDAESADRLITILENPVDQWEVISATHCANGIQYLLRQVILS